MNRGEAFEAISHRVKNENLLKHMIATEAIMQALARKLGENEEEWGLVGLLHDIDVELCANDITSHSKLGAELVKTMGMSDKVAHAILAHNEQHGDAGISVG